MSTFVHRSDTNAATISVTLHQISVNPEIEAKVRAELAEVSALPIAKVISLSTSQTLSTFSAFQGLL
jgi:hypothetical protein